MPHGICHLSVVPVRVSPDNSSTMLTQLLYGDYFKILEDRKDWHMIRVANDHTEGWVMKRQTTPLSPEEITRIKEEQKPGYSCQLLDYASLPNSALIPVLLGSLVSNSHILAHKFEGEYLNGTANKANLVPTALYYLHAPFLSGGKTPFGIDDAGLSQMVYRINGYPLPRTAPEQAMMGESLSFIEESVPGDLAFFDDKEGKIDHVGIIMKDNYIVHAFGQVRIDRLDHTGIFNTELRKYTHPLRVIKKIV